MPGVRVQAFLLSTAFFVQSKHLRLREAVALSLADPRRIESQVREDFVKIVSAQRADTFGSDDAMLATVQLDQGCIKRSPAQVVNQNLSWGFFRVYGPVTVAELDARGRGFVQEPQDVEAGLPERLRRQESLVAIGIRRDAEHRFEMV